ncbi:MAG: hypothetical protein AAF063_33460 [Cyanobacteria bacterium J06643_5]
MTDFDYTQLNEKDLREYVKKHPQDEDAFQYYLSIVRRKPGKVVAKDGDELEKEIKRRLGISS